MANHAVTVEKGTAAVPVRSKLFVPGSRPELFAKAFASAADAVSIDLEDAVPEAGKADARRRVAHFLGEAGEAINGKTVIVRVNGLTTPHFAADVEAMACDQVDMLNLPKAESADDVRELALLLARIEKERDARRPVAILANIESPRGLRLAHEIAAADPRVIGLQLGFGDLFEPFGIDRRDAIALRQVQLAVRFAAAEAGVQAYDGAFPDIGDMEGFLGEARQARRLGYAGKSCIHPSQIGAANTVFSPDKAEVASARRILAAWEDAAGRGIGALVVDGKMIDQPYADRARSLVMLAERYGL